ncbi:MAG: hypothetical protein ABJA67_01585 [Chthonomonadales bacterium]
MFSIHALVLAALISKSAVPVNTHQNPTSRPLQTAMIKSSPTILKGIKRVILEIEPINKDAERAGLRFRDIKKDTEQLLKSAGLQTVNVDVDTKEAVGVAKASDKSPIYSPALNITVGTMLTDNRLVVYKISIQLYDEVTLQRNPLGMVIGAVTWDLPEVFGLVGVENISEVRKEVKEMVGKFCEAYEKVNPK